MRRIMIAAIAFAAGVSLAGVSLAWAQGTTPPMTPGTGIQTPGSAATGGAGAAPVGHRQPRRADVPDEQRTTARTPEDRALDRKIKSICRGC
jgi:hypothetical protein